MARIDVGRYPELQSILSLAVDAAVYTFDIDDEADRDLVSLSGSRRLPRPSSPPTPR